MRTPLVYCLLTFLSAASCYRPNSRYCDELVPCPGSQSCNLGTHSCGTGDGGSMSSVSITTVTPAAVSIAGGGSVTITGSGFQKDATVKFGDLNAAITRLTDTEIQVTAPAGVAIGCGKVAITVVNPDSSSARRDDLFRYSISNIKFTAQTPFHVAAGDFASLAAGDFNGDRKTDIIAVTRSAMASYVFAPGNGSLGFGATTLTAIPFGTYTKALDVSLNDDDIRDFLFYDPSGIYVVPFRGQPSGNFGNPSYQPYRAATVFEYASSRQPNDLGVVKAPIGELFLMINDGAGGFGASVQTPITNLSTAASGDLDGDGKSDIIGAHQNGVINFYKGQDLRTFADPVPMGNLANATYAETVDLDGDGKLDAFFIAQDVSSSTAVAYTPSAASTFSQLLTPVALEKTITGYFLRDLTCDGRPELITYKASTPLRIYLNSSRTGTAKFEAVTDLNAQFLGASLSVESVAIGNFDEDRRPDLVVLRGSSLGDVIVLKNESE